MPRSEGESDSCWVGNPTMVWKGKHGFKIHLLMAGMNCGGVGFEKDQDCHLPIDEIKRKAVNEAREYAKKCRIKCYVLHCRGFTTIDSGY
jgi:hypothetical protein